MQCPPDMVVVTAAPAENNHVVIAAESSGRDLRNRFVVTDPAGALQAGPGARSWTFRRPPAPPGPSGRCSSATVTTRSPPPSVQVTWTVATDKT